MFVIDRLTQAIPSPRSRSRRFFQSREWETGCASPFADDEGPDRLVFVVSLALLPLLWLI